MNWMVTRSCISPEIYLLSRICKLWICPFRIFYNLIWSFWTQIDIDDSLYNFFPKASVLKWRGSGYYSDIAIQYFTSFHQIVVQRLNRFVYKFEIQSGHKWMPKLYLYRDKLASYWVTECHVLNCERLGIH